jgi:hypothetical protein
MKRFARTMNRLAKTFGLTAVVVAFTGLAMAQDPAPKPEAAPVPILFPDDPLMMPTGLPRLPPPMTFPTGVPVGPTAFAPAFSPVAMQYAISF